MFSPSRTHRIGLNWIGVEGTCGGACDAVSSYVKKKVGVDCVRVSTGSSSLSLSVGWASVSMSMAWSLVTSSSLSVMWPGRISIGVFVSSLDAMNDGDAELDEQLGSIWSAEMCESFFVRLDWGRVSSIGVECVKILDLFGTGDLFSEFSELVLVRRFVSLTILGMSSFGFFFGVFFLDSFGVAFFCCSLALGFFFGFSANFSCGRNRRNCKNFELRKF